MIRTLSLGFVALVLLAGCQFNRRSGFVRLWADYNTLGQPAFFIEEQTDRAYTPDCWFKYHSWIDNRRTRPPFGFVDVRTRPDEATPVNQPASVDALPSGRQQRGGSQSVHPHSDSTGTSSQSATEAPGSSSAAVSPLQAGPPGPGTAPSANSGAAARGGPTGAGPQATGQAGSSLSAEALEPARSAPVRPVPVPPVPKDSLPEPLPLPEDAWRSADQPDASTAGPSTSGPSDSNEGSGSTARSPQTLVPAPPPIQPEQPEAVLPHLETPAEPEGSQPFRRPRGPTARRPSAVHRSSFSVEQLDGSLRLPQPGGGTPASGSGLASKVTDAFRATGVAPADPPATVRPPGVWLFW